MRSFCGFVIALVGIGCGGPAKPAVGGSQSVILPPRPANCELEIITVRPEDMAPGARFGAGGQYQMIGVVALGLKQGTDVLSVSRLVNAYVEDVIVGARNERRDPRTLQEATDDFHRGFVLQALEYRRIGDRWNIMATAKDLGVSRNQIYALIDRLRLQPSRAMRTKGSGRVPS
jgi:hypothetical protein